MAATQRTQAALDAAHRAGQAALPLRQAPLPLPQPLQHGGQLLQQGHYGHGVHGAPNRRSGRRPRLQRALPHDPRPPGLLSLLQPLRSGLRPPFPLRLLPSPSHDSGRRSWPSLAVGGREGGREGGGVLRKRFPSAALPRGALWESRLTQLQPHPIPQTHSELPSSVPIPWCASFRNLLSTRKGEPWKILLSASSGQRNYSIYVSAAKG